MNFCEITGCAMVSLLSSCSLSSPGHSPARDEATRSAREFMSAESYQSRMNEIEATDRFWDSDRDEFDARLHEIEHARALYLSSMSSE